MNARGLTTKKMKKSTKKKEKHALAAAVQETPQVVLLTRTVCARLYNDAMLYQRQAVDHVDQDPPPLPHTHAAKIHLASLATS